MRRINTETDTYYIGTAREILRAWEHLSKSGTCIPSHCGTPQVNLNKMYGLDIDYTLGQPLMIIINDDTICRLLADGWI